LVDIEKNINIGSNREPYSFTNAFQKYNCMSDMLPVASECEREYF